MNDKSLCLAHRHKMISIDYNCSVDSQQTPKINMKNEGNFGKYFILNFKKETLLAKFYKVKRSTMFSAYKLPKFDIIAVENGLPF